jgi:hypothetical protein
MCRNPQNLNKVGIKKAALEEAAYYEFSSIQRNKHAGSCQKWHEKAMVVRGVITMIAFPEPCALKTVILTEASEQSTLHSFFVFRHQRPCAATARARRDHNLFFDFKVFIDVLTVQA